MLKLIKVVFLSLTLYYTGLCFFLFCLDGFNDSYFLVGCTRMSYFCVAWKNSLCIQTVVAKYTCVWFSLLWLIYMTFGCYSCFREIHTQYLL